jgi:excisionase family DNA binding protein
MDFSVPEISEICEISEMAERGTCRTRAQVRGLRRLRVKRDQREGHGVTKGDELSVAQAAELLNVSEETVRRLFDAGTLAGHRTRPIIGNRRISRASVEAYRAEHYGEERQS